MESSVTPSQDKLPYKVAETITRGGTTFEVLEYEPLSGSETFGIVDQVFSLNRAGVRLRQLRVRLTNDAVRTEPGALQFLKGNLTMQSTTGGEGGMMGFAKAALTAARTSESVFKPQYKGNGELYLEPTFGHYWMMDISNQTLFADQGLFFCCEDSVKVEAHKVETFTGRVAGGEGRYQTKVSGSGIVVFKIPVPKNEIVALSLTGDTVQVDGSFALLRTDNVQFSVEKSSKSLIGSVTSGEGLLQTFRGTGTVWIAPTLPLYEKMGLGLSLSMPGAG